MKPNCRILLGLRLVSAALILSLTGGCRCFDGWSVTHSLWHGTAFTDFRSPADEPRVELFTDAAGSDVLVIYDEVADNSDRVRRRAFFVSQNLDRIADGRRPRFTTIHSRHRLKRIPVLEAGEETPPPLTGPAIRRTDDPNTLRLFRDGRDLGTVTLPSYRANGALGKSLVTPLAVTADTVIAASVVGLFAAVAYARSGVTIDGY